jgi:phosphatidate cytidylyltransferase
LTSRDDRPSADRHRSHGLFLRILSALVLAPAVLFVVHQGGLPFAVAMVLAAFIMSVEWSAPVYGKLPAPGFVLQILAAFMGVLAMVRGEGLLALATVAACTGTAILIDLANKRSPLWPLLGIPYAALFAVAGIWLRGETQDGRDLLFWLFAIVWATDSLAYIVGSLIGGAKLWPRISPNKTWAGLGGGLAGAVAASVVVGKIFLTKLSLPFLVSSGLCLGAIAQAGDLAESAFKRRFGLKDSGRLIPGHGGLLDRIDGLVFAVLTTAMIALLAGV